MWLLSSSLSFSSRASFLIKTNVNIFPCARFHLQPVCHGWANEHKPVPRGKHRSNRHRDPHLRKLRNYKYMRIELPDIEFTRNVKQNKLSPSELKEKMKEQGILPPLSESEIPTYMSSMGDFIETYVPPEGDEKSSIVSAKGAKQSAVGMQKKGKSYFAVRKIRQYEEGFDPRKFASQAEQIYINAHEALAEQDEEKLLKYATEKAFPEMMHNVKRKTIRWQFIKQLEEPRVVQVRKMDLLTSDNLFAQVTVRFFSQQTLAVYDRFGRLIHGSPVTAKDVLEYVVFEKHMANVYGQWRLHGKIIPDWKEAKPDSLLTSVIELEDEEVVEKTEKSSGVAKADPEDADKDEDSGVYDRFGRKL